MSGTLRERARATLSDLVFRAIVVATLIVVAICFAQNNGPHSDGFWEKIEEPITVLTFALVVVSAIQLYLLNQSTQAAVVSADAAKTSSDVARATLIASQRAWLRVTPTLSDVPLIFNQHGAIFAVGVTIKNQGNAPATYVRPYAWLVAEGAAQLAWQRLENERNRVRAGLLGGGFTLFPEETFPLSAGLQGHALGLSLSKDDLEKSVTVDGPHRQVALTIIGFVDYSFPTDPDVHHQTPFIRQVLPLDFLPLDRNVLKYDPKHLELRQNAAWTPQAD